MPWSEISPGHWQRPIGENEAMIKWIGDRAHPTGREHWSVRAIGGFDLSGSLDDVDISSRLRKAWMLFRFQHPSIASTASTNSLDYIVPDAEALERWTDETLHVISEPGITADDLVANLKPSPYVTGYFIAHPKQFILHTAHWRTDGPGILQLLNAFFEAFVSELDPATVPWGNEPVRLAPSVEEVLELPQEPTPEIQAATAECLKSGALVAGSIGLPYHNDASIKPQGTRGVRRTLSKSITDSVLDACKARNLTPLSAAHASLAAANFVGCTSSPSEMGHYTSNMRFSLRPYLKEPFNSAQYASALYTGSYMAKVPPNNSWLENAEQYNTMYNAGLNHEFLIARRQFATQILAFLKRAGELGPPRSEIDISSVDDAEKLVQRIHRSGTQGGGSLKVKDISLGIECLAKESYLFFWTFAGKIELNLIFNEAFYDRDFMERIMEEIERSLKRELEVENV
ncbi:uncharacterized protein F4822DRAFT_323317 [Hypoxylon trugodes]|uniref:uncharacterized protein n=1 Tax=Hypoxylon trugodes TaxID=326681 RepID=UPI002192580A|nr:uncharacterized protein F4822DRAFT_323317 [Hypoxylon trugodes]KAI1386658.1 hypothetical protein F4822DRAFT_323317 [Hypoxylon trugodes]